ncbi:hypothetical protein PL75_02245 [Neisseria arctica]|uniref:DUF4124 domain-containing protein n=1 Tax=Neisseria arctica TaxID=1470200 RepID=A0A0J0YTI7_9NEIS|nr:DUF4124 domain-containing protein [Neisseria arctica]KLT73420.1 hypothetical protein PL75_02245 [Neisseria arctica]UOO86075.1 DUF4124 domain-containing protein [Neisseria arctica]
MKRFTLLCISLLTASYGNAATVYECTSANGQRIYTQSPGKNCQKANLGKPEVYSSLPINAYNNQAASNENEAVTAEAQESNQVSLARQNLSEAQKALAEGKKVRYGNERNYARYQQRIGDLEAAVKRAEEQLNQSLGVIR